MSQAVSVPDLFTGLGVGMCRFDGDYALTPALVEA